MEVLWLFVTLTATQQCHPECPWVCDNPVCYANCDPVCSAPVCQRCVNQTGTPVCRATHACTVFCPEDMCEMEQCPACEVQCPQLCATTANCTVTCDPIQCEWSCRLPTCPHPTCVRQCEAPACEASEAAHYSASLLVGLVTLMLVTTA
jgi:hypothetical protein